MADPIPDFAAVPDGQTLRRLEGGIEIIRREKHEPISFHGMTRKELERATDKENGSQFAADWTLQRYVEWLTAVVRVAGWRFPPSPRGWAHIRMQDEIGVADGVASHTSEVVVRGRYVHAYPIED